MKNIKKIFILITVIIIISGIYFLIKNNNETISETKNVSSTGISEYSEEFMQEYFEKSKELSKKNNKENILIVNSKHKPSNTFGATDIVEAPNNQYILQYKSKEDKEKALKGLSKDKEIQNVEENMVYTIFEDKTYNSWGIEKIGLDQATEVVSKNAKEITVAIIDSGCDMDLFNQNYNGKIKETYNVLNPDGDMVDEDGHGTHIAGTIAEGTPSNVNILPIKVSTDGNMYTTDIVLAIEYIVQYKKADVINMSFGGYGKSLNLEQAIKNANDAGIICVAAAGNDNTSQYAYPAAFDTTISIAACDSNLKKASFSNYGSTITFTAPGVNILSINGTMNGTSMATPHAVCAVAILKSFNQEYKLDNIINILKEYAIDLGDTGKDNYFGYGLVSFVGATYCECNCEKCDSIYCNTCNCNECIFKEEINIVKKIEVVAPAVLPYNYGSITNLSPTQVRIYYDDTLYINKYLLELDECEITGYDPYCYTNQTITIKYKNQQTSFELCKEEYESGWEYEKIDENNIRLTSYKESGYNATGLPDLYIPQTIDGFTVKALGEKLFYLAMLEEVVLPSTVTEIGTRAFYSSGLEKIDIQAENINIGDYAFRELSNLKTINSTITTLGQGAFYNCVMLDNISLANTLEKISTSAFSGCANLTNIAIPSSVKTIGISAFLNTNIKNIVIPSGVTKIESDAFAGCVNLESVTISEGIEEIGEYAFGTCSNIKDLYIPKTITNIGDNAFMQCTGLQTIVVDEENKNYDSRENCNALIETATNKLLLGTHTTTIPNTIKIIGEYAFAYNFNVVEINIPEEIIEIQDYAFYNCSYMKDIYIPNSVTKIGNRVFGGNNSLIVWVYKDSYAKTYAIENDLNYKCIDYSKMMVNVPKKEYKAFEEVDTEGMYILLTYDDGRKEYIREGFNIKYPNGNTSFRYGDTYFTVSTFSETGIYIEKQITVTITKITPQYVVPDNLVAKDGQKLSEIQLPDGFEWMDDTQIIQGAGNLVYKAKFIPEDTINYETMENIEITIFVIKDKTIITPLININDKTYDGTTTIDISSIKISNLESKDYTIEGAVLSSNEVGETTAKVKLKLTDKKFENYTLDNGKQENEYSIKAEIIPAQIEKPSKVDKTYTYNGNDQQIELTNFDSSKMNIEGNIRKNAGKQTVTISLKNKNYVWNDNSTEDVIFTFEIEKADANIEYKSQDISYAYDGNLHSGILNIIKPDNVNIKFMDENGKYTLDEMPKYSEIGSYTIKYKIFIDDNYIDILGEQILTIYQKDISNNIQVTGIKSKTYNGRPLTQDIVLKIDDIVLKEGTDYTINYQNNINAGTATIVITGKGNYTGTITKTFKINAVSFINSKVSGIKTKEYTGKNLTQLVVVKNENKTLVKDKDYQVTYSNQKNPGKATVKITGIGNYAGTITKTFIIKPKKVSGFKVKEQKTDSIKLSWSKHTGVTGYKVYSYNYKKEKWEYVGKTSSTSYTIKKLKAATTYKYRVRAYKTVDGTQHFGSYTSSLKTTTKTKTPSISKLTTKSKKATIKWKKVSGATGYQIYMSTSKNGKYEKIKTITKGSTVSYTKTKLKKNKKYYFKIRTYRTVDGKKVYSSYSSVKSIKVK